MCWAAAASRPAQGTALSILESLAVMCPTGIVWHFINLCAFLQGETAAEIAGLAKAMHELSVPVVTDYEGGQGRQRCVEFWQGRAEGGAGQAALCGRKHGRLRQVEGCSDEHSFVTAEMAGHGCCLLFIQAVTVTKVAGCENMLDRGASFLAAYLLGCWPLLQC